MKTINICEDEKKYFGNIFKILGNNNEFFRFSKEIQGNISYENAVQRIEIKKEHKADFDEEIAFISSNFHDFHTKYTEALFALDIDIIERIITNDKLKLCNEEELFDIILKLYMKSKEYSLLFAYVIFLNLSTQSIQEFTKNFDINDINDSIWKNICCRLEQNISIESIKAYKESHQNFLNNRYSAQWYEHIIQYLSEQCHENIQIQNLVQITSSSIWDSKFGAENIIKQNDQKKFGTKNEVNSWVQFDFKKTKVMIDSYTLKTWNEDETFEHLKNWILEVSNDGKNYTEIDRQINCDLLRGKLKTATFNVFCSTPQ